MLTVERREFTSTLDRRGGLDVDALSPQTMTALSERGVDTEALREVAGADHVIRGVELDRLYDVLTRGAEGAADTSGRRGDILRSDRLWAALQTDSARAWSATPSAVAPSGREATGMRAAISGTRRTTIEVPDPEPEEATAAAEDPAEPAALAEASAVEETEPATDRSAAVASIMAGRTRSVVGSADADAFATIDAANRATESGGRSVYSTLRTTAGFPASYGEGQLTVREHLTELSALSDAELESIGIDRSEIDGMQAHGRAAEAFYALANGTVDRGHRPGMLRDSGLSEAESRRLATLTGAGDWDQIETEFGANFAERTGLPSSELRMMTETSLLRRADLRSEWRSTFRSVNGHAFDPEHRNSDEMRAATEAMVARHPELADLHDRLGGSSMGYYLGRGDTAENEQAWYARAAAGTTSRPEFDEMMADVDPLTTRMRHLSNFSRARTAVDSTGASGAERTELIGRLSRQFHGAPGWASRHYLEGGHGHFRSVGALREDLASLPDRRAASDRRFLGRYRALTGAAE